MTITRSQERINKTGEVFTPAHLVKEMLDALPPALFQDPIKTFLDPACGDGNFLVQVLQRKLDNGAATIFQALHTTYGVELMADNVVVCKQRLKDIALDHLAKTAQHSGKTYDMAKILLTIETVLNHNIVCHDSLTWDYEAWQPLGLE